MAIIPFEAEYQDFLYALICPEREGMSLSMLSALARQDVDPWSEARRLAQLPAETALNQIVQLLKSLPRESLGGRDCVEEAGRLRALLPTQAALHGSRHASAPALTPVASPFDWRYMVFYVWLLLLMNLLAEGHPQSAAPTAPTSGAATGAPGSDQSKISSAPVDTQQ